MASRPKKDERASGAYAKNGIVQRAVRQLKRDLPGLLVMTDVCLCEYMSHGHCGLVKKRGGQAIIDNDPSLKLLARTAVSHAEAGADVVAPSDMMDGRVAAIRAALDSGGFGDTPIMSYAAKFASAYYGPFRDAAESVPQFGDRRSYQMDAANVEEALREVALDLREGADIVMVKPALAYLDVLYRVKAEFGLPDGGVRGERRVLNGAGGGQARLGGRAGGDDGVATGHAASGGGHHRDLRGSQGGALAEGGLSGMLRLAKRVSCRP